MKYNSEYLPDFYSVRNFEQIDYSFEGMENSKCYCFFDNGFVSNIIEPNNRDMRFIWDGFILFTDPNITFYDLKNGINLYTSRLVALQRTSVHEEKFNNNQVREYIINKFKEKNISYEIMNDKNLVSGYPSESDLWSTRDFSVLLDAIDTIEKGSAYFFKNADFKYEINFNYTQIPSFSYSHNGALVLRGENNVAISRLIVNNQELCKKLEELIGSKILYSYLEGKYLSGLEIGDLEKKL